MNKKIFSHLVYLLVTLVFALPSSLVFADLSAIVSDCENCHGKEGVSLDPKVPTIAGYSAYYLEDSLLVYLDKARPCPEITYKDGEKKGTKTTMCAAVMPLSDEQIKGVAEHFAAKPFVRAKQNFDAALAEKGKALHETHCKKCHENGGSSADDDAGILAGQWMPYLAEQLKDYVEGKRRMDEKMKPKINDLKDEDFKALVNYYGSFK